jgi:hypothetical protein
MIIMENGWLHNEYYRRVIKVLVMIDFMGNYGTSSSVRLSVPGSINYVT